MVYSKALFLIYCGLSKPLMENVFSFILHAGCPGDLDKYREINFKYLESEVTVECNQRQIHRETIPYPQNLFIKISQDIIGIHLIVSVQSDYLSCAAF